MRDFSLPETPQNPPFYRGKSARGAFADKEGFWVNTYPLVGRSPGCLDMGVEAAVLETTCRLDGFTIRGRPWVAK